MKLPIIMLMLALGAPAFTVAQTRLSVSRACMDSTIAPDPAMLALIVPYRDSIATSLSSIIGQADMDLEAYAPESPLSNFVADLILDKMKEEARLTGSVPVPDMSIVNLGGLRAPIAKGDITMSTVFQVMPFENTIVVVEVTGRQLRSAFDNMARRGGDGLSGAHLTIDGGRVASVSVGGRPIDPDATYRVATYNFIADGGDGYTAFVGCPVSESGIMVRQAIIDRIVRISAAGRGISAAVEGRITNEKD